MTDKLTSDEDAVLRRLHWFEQFGIELSPSMQGVKEDIRERDKRDEIREPPDVVAKEPFMDLDDDHHSEIVDEPSEEIREGLDS